MKTTRKSQRLTAHNRGILAYLRGALRGGDEPLNADGTIFTEAGHG